VLETAGAGLRPLGTTALVDAAIEHVRDDPVLFYGIAAPVTLPLAAVGLYFFDLVRDYRGDAAGYGPRVALGAGLLTILFHLRFVSHGALAWALERRLRGLETSAAAAWGAALRRSVTLAFSGSLLWMLCSVAGFFAFVPAIVPFALFCLGPAVAMVEETGPLRTLRRSMELGWLELGRSFAIGLVLSLGLLALALGGAFAVEATLGIVRTVFYADLSYWETLLSWKNPTFFFGAFLAGAVLIEPVKTLSYALLYVDRRVRKEGFDLRRKIQLILDAEKKSEEVNA
jgi:hypothetical protein